jgi:putative flippase GtrA
MPIEFVQQRPPLKWCLIQNAFLRPARTLDARACLRGRSIAVRVKNKAGMQAIWRQVEQMRASGVLGQLVRFGIAGGISSVVYSLVYLPLTAYVFPPRQAVAAVPFAFAVAVVVGFFLHSRWSFKGHAKEPGAGRHVKFVIVQGSGLALNAVITWIGTALLHLHPWIPLIPAVFLAAIVTFVLNRFWVFN